MEKTMLDVLKERLIDGLNIVKVKEYHGKYQIEFQFEHDITKVDLPKSCLPGCENKVADNAIITAMSTIYFNRKDYMNAKLWLDTLYN